MSDWKNYKNSGPWNFKKQSNKWGYLNNKFWSNQSDAQYFCNIDGVDLPLDLTDEHLPCGHWHLPEIVRGEFVSFPVGRLKGWDSVGEVLDNPWVFGWDTDYGQWIKIDMTTLDAIDYVPVDPGFGRGILDPGLIGFKYQIIDACDLYGYLIFASGDIFRIFKIDIQTMTVVKQADFPNLSRPDINGGCADMQWIYMTTAEEGKIIIIPADLDITQYTTVIASPAVQGAFIGSVPGGERGIKVDPYTDLLYITGNQAAGAVTLHDLSVVAVWYPDTEGALLGGNAWSSNLLWSRRYGVGYQMQSYHPFAPRAYVFPGIGFEHETHMPNACGGSADWSDCGAFYQAYCSFFGYTPYEHNGIGRLSFGQVLTNDWFVATLDGLTPKLPGIELAADKRNCKPVLKIVSGYAGTPDPDPFPATFLTRLTDDLVVEQYRHQVMGYKSLITPANLNESEPQIWTMVRTF